MVLLGSGYVFEQYGRPGSYIKNGLDKRKAVISFYKSFT